MRQDELSPLREDIKELTATVHSFKESFAASDARQEDRIERLEHMMAFFGILEKIRMLLTR